MSYDELENAWRSPRNTADAATLASARERFFAELASRRRGARVLMAVATVWMVVITGRVIWNVLSGAGPSGFELRQDWAALLFLLLPWVGLIALLRHLRRHEREHGRPERSVRACVRALLDENAVSRTRLKVVAALHGGALLLLPLVVWQLRAAGKAGDEILWPAFVGWPVVALAIFAGLVWHDRARLRPRQRQLEQLLGDYERAD